MEEGSVLLEILKASFSVVGTVIGATIVYQLIDFRKKQRLDTYWRIEKEHKSDYRKEGRILLGIVEEDLMKKKDELTQNKISDEQIRVEVIKYYNANWHNSQSDDKREKSRKVRHRIREHHEYGILLRKGMVDRDLLFSMMGFSFELDYQAMKIILEALRVHHKTPYMYNHFEYLWSSYIKWKKKSKLMK